MVPLSRMCSLLINPIKLGGSVQKNSKDGKKYFKRPLCKLKINCSSSFPDFFLIVSSTYSTFSSFHLKKVKAYLNVKSLILHDNIKLYILFLYSVVEVCGLSLGTFYIYLFVYI